LDIEDLATMAVATMDMIMIMMMVDSLDQLTIITTITPINALEGAMEILIVSGDSVSATMDISGGMDSAGELVQSIHLDPRLLILLLHVQQMMPVKPLTSTWSAIQS